ncbi:DMSO reductase anchor subunit [Hoeflea marina]|uniref:DMSO reductase anchor subunit n=1 Tax=Hoeflea marina TaxID=274592 RepID=A0A317PPK7_9HYPH|nr:DmsC/YnfH family molybdoenzyme membrane anchor subunit [Hoeflea marina]PWW00441.1 DMSO reductase anchor subunit [Hoeflea marina]
MHPAISVIFFTVTSGAGFGLIALTGLGFPFGGGALSVFLFCLLGGGLAVAGLIASTFHLGHPERAWRAFSQWRSSWLSREGVAAVATLSLFAIYALIWMMTGDRLLWLGLIVAAGAAYTVFATSMIYAQLKTVPQWRSRWTPAVYLAFSLASGWLLAAGFGDLPGAGIWGAVLLALAWGIKLMWWRRAADARLAGSASSPESATGLGFIGKVRLLERPHTGANYLTREMVHQIGRKHAGILRRLAVLFGAIVPLMVSATVWLTAAPEWVLLAAALSLFAGLFAERWLFFAEAEHSVSLYYGNR